MAHELNDQEVERREGLNRLRELGINPYPAALYPLDSNAVEVKGKFNEEGERWEVCLAGRMMSKRIMGKASFAELMDHTGRIQLYVNRDEICPEDDKIMYNDVFKKVLDIGDFIGVKGYVFKTKVGRDFYTC